MSRYVEAVLPDQASSPRRVRIGQEGEMVLKPGRRALRFAAVEEFSVDAVAFAWRARFPILGPLALRVTDSYEPPAAGLEVRFAGVPVQRQSGPEVARGQALRYLAELTWVPQAILSNRQLKWREFDARSAEVSTQIGDARVAVRVVFEKDEVVQTIADRPRLEAKGALTRWIGEYGDYTTFNGIRMPARGEVRWELPEGPFTYWRGVITSAEAVE